MPIPTGKARRRLSSLIEEVNSDRTAVKIVTSTGSAYLVPAAEYESFQETTYLLRSPTNAQRLLSSYHEALDGRHAKPSAMNEEKIAAPRL